MATYKPRCILVTGGAGFIGSHVVDLLQRQYPSYKLVVLDKLDYCASLTNIEHLVHTPNCRFVEGDVRSADLVRYLLKEERVDTVLHFAAQTHVDNSFGNSFEFTKNNIEGTHVLLEACKKTGTVKRFLHVSTDEVYGETSYESSESNLEHVSLLEPTNPYSATKAGAEMLVMAYGRSYNLQYIITRGNNVYGPKQFPEKVIPKFVLMLQRSLKVPIHGTGTNTRSYMHVDDAARAFDAILHKGAAKEVYNIAARDERSILSVASDICRIMNKPFEENIEYVQDRAFNDRRYLIDNSKLSMLGWSQQILWSHGLPSTVEWYTRIGSTYWGDIASVLRPHPLQGALHALAATAACDACILNDLKEAEGQPIFLIYGRTGWIGGLLGELLAADKIKYFYGTARLQDSAGIEQDLMRYKPTHILNAAGLTGRPNVDWCENHKLEVIEANVLGTLSLITIAHARSIHVTNFATGCIYTYDESHTPNGKGFTEADKPNFRGSFYSHTKAVVEDLIQHYNNVLQLRLRMPISRDLLNPRNFIYKISQYDKVVDVPNSMTVLDELLPFAIRAALQRTTGILNFTNPGVISHNEVLSMYREHCDPLFVWQNFSLEEQEEVLLAPRSNNFLCTKRLESLFPEILDIKKSLKKYVFEVNAANGVRIPLQRRDK